MKVKVTAWKSGKSQTDTSCSYGIYLGAPKRDALFVAGRASVSVQIDKAFHTFSLARASFWGACPELRDADTTGTPVRDLLRQLNRLTWKKWQRPRFELRSLQRGGFRLVPSTH